MAPYPETETMTIKRIRVALKKGNIELLKEGIEKIKEKFKDGHRWELERDWIEVKNSGDLECMPLDARNDFYDIVNNILSYIDRAKTTNDTPSLFHQVENNSQEEIQEEFLAEMKNTLANACVIYNNPIKEQEINSIRSYRGYLENIIGNNETNVSLEFLQTGSKLSSTLDKKNVDIKELMSVLYPISSGGSFVSFSYDTNIIKFFNDNSVDFSIDGMKNSTGALNVWNYYPLGGSLVGYVCSKCLNHFSSSELEAKSVVSSCPNCTGASFMDIQDIHGTRAFSNSKMWLKSLRELINSKVWILINPPEKTGNSAFENLIKNATGISRVKKIYIMTADVERSNSWRNSLQNIATTTSYPNMKMLVDDLKLDANGDIFTQEEEIKVLG